MRIRDGKESRGPLERGKLEGVSYQCVVVKYVKTECPFTDVIPWVSGSGDLNKSRPRNRE